MPSRLLMVGLVALAALAIRGSVIATLPPRPLEGDSVGYDDLAWRLIEGKGYTRRWAPEAPYLRRPPGYPVWLAGVYAVAGHSPQAARWAQAVLDTTTAVLITALAWRWAGAVAGLLAGLLYACYPPLVMFTTYLVSETMFIWLVVALVWSLLLAWTTQRWRWWITAGALLGCAHLVKSVLFAFPLVLFGVLWAGTRQFRPAVLRAAVVAGVSLLVAAPWAVRNWRVSGRVLLAQEGLGWALWAGTLDPYSDPFIHSEEVAWTHPTIAARLAGETSMETISERLRPEAVAIIRRDPGRYLWLGLKKAWRMVTVPWGLTRVSQYAPWAWWPYLLGHIALWGVALFGGGWLLRSSAQREAWLILGLIGYMVAFFAVFFVVPRYALPLMPFVICWSAIGAAVVLGRQGNRQPA